MRAADLYVCKRCGWHEHEATGGGFRCDPEAGAAADKLARLVGVPSTKLGYGGGMLATR